MKKRGSQIFYQKKGISNILVTILLVALVLVAVSVVWFVVRRLISESTSSLDIGQLTINLKITDAYTYESSSDVYVKVKRNPGKGDLAAIKFIFVNETETEVITRDVNLEELDEKTYTFLLNELNASNVASVSIAPVIEASSGERITGNILDTFYIRTLSGTGGTNGTGGGSGGGYCGDGICDSNETCLNCEADCGVCGSEEYCGNGVCGVGEDCSTCEADCGVCYSPTCGDGFCDESGGETYENCPSDCPLPCDPPCQEGQFCDNGVCVNDLIISGTVDSVWPSDAVKYFDSSDLPTDGSETDLILKYINFTGYETGCVQILDAQHIYDPPYDKTHLQLERVVNITSGDNFTIYHSTDCGAGTV